MPLFAQSMTAAVILIHICIVLIETVLFENFGRKIFGFSDAQAGSVKKLMANQGCYNMFLVAALLIGMFSSQPEIAKAFTLYGLLCVVVAGVFGAITSQMRILFIQALPAAIALVAYQLG